jgi:hypothetical protein
MLKSTTWEKANSDNCELCHRVQEEESIRLRQLAQQFQRTMFVEWMKSQGTLCLDHAAKLKEFVPLRYRTLIAAIMERNRAQLCEELEGFHEQLKHGVHSGGGLLGRVAEFLVGQRGL